MGLDLGLFGFMEDFLGMPEEKVNEVKKLLHEHAMTVKKGQPTQAGSGVFGGSLKGAGLEHHASVAHQHVVDALTEMAEGLQIYINNLRDFAEDLGERDFEAAQALTPSRKRELLEASQDLDSHNMHNDGGEG